ncbi:MAG: allantoate amidohydrolase [Pleurocapsa sp. SU_196_0]|nr:allantoate amidohydrolase [Pleurocapsa sp. SU_196_0]
MATLERSTVAALSQEALERCEALAACSEEPGRITRTFLSYPMKQVHQLLGMWMREAGLSVRVDAVGNVIGRLEGTATTKALLIGSHVDTVPNAGKYDGCLGVTLGIALAKSLSLQGKRLPFALEIIAFSEEEGVRFKAPFIGSRAVAGSVTRDLLEKTDANGVSVTEAILNFGLEATQIPSAAHRAEDVLGYFEMHIEQGPVLEHAKRALGVVEGINGQTRAQLEFTGQSAHAGTTPMNLRRDALTAAATFILEVERFAKATPGLVATVGALEVENGAGNVIPGSVKFSLDVRHLDNATRERSVAELLDFAWHTARKRKLQFAHRLTLEQPASLCNPLLTDFLGDALEDAKHKLVRLPSGAGHDAMVMATLTRTAMLFLRSPNGLSHHPDENVLPGDARTALEVGIGFVEKLGDAQTRGVL